MRCGFTTDGFLGAKSAGNSFVTSTLWQAKRSNLRRLREVGSTRLVLGRYPPQPTFLDAKTGHQLHTCGVSLDGTANATAPEINDRFMYASIRFRISM